MTDNTDDDTENLLATAYVFSTSRDQVWLVKGSDPDEAEQHLKEQIDWDEQSDDQIHYECRLDDVRDPLRAHGIALLNL